MEQLALPRREQPPLYELSDNSSFFLERYIKENKMLASSSSKDQR